jgi:lysine 2,3-aminomutase
MGKGLPMRDAGAWREGAAAAITTEEQLSRLIHLSSAEKQAIRAAGSVFRWRITPYYAGLMDPYDPSCPIRRQAIPSMEELDDETGCADPIGEEAGTVAPNLIRLYPDRIAWCVTGACPVICRFCFRRKVVGKEEGDFSEETLQRAISYIAGHPEIRDVLVTGGDPLMLSDERLDGILRKLRQIPHVEIVRIGTRAPVTMPQRITPELCRMLSSHHPLWINTHFNHPRELTPSSIEACASLANAGIPLGNQSVLLRGVNDDPSVMKSLVHGLVKARIRPYYLFQCHLIKGTAHFRTPIENGLRIVSGLRGSTTGFAVPAYVVDTPHGKVPLAPQTIARRDEQAVYLRCPDGAIWREENPKTPRQRK